MAHDLPARLPHPGHSERTLTVLVAEDEVLIRAALVDYLEEHGFIVLEAGDAVAAIQLMSYGDLAIDGVITDISMPGEIDGMGLVNWARRNRPHVPIVVTSGFYSEAAQAAGNTICFFQKPYDCEIVAEKLCALIGDE